MSTWKVDTRRKSGILWLELEGTFTPEEMQAFVTAHNRGVDTFGDEDYQVFCDIRQLKVLSPECASLFETAKSYSAAHKNFRGSGVWTEGATTSMQHRRTSISSGVIGSELISNDQQALWTHLAKLTA